MDVTLLSEKAELFDKNPPLKYKPREAKSQFEEFQKHFAKENVETMTIERYSLGFGADSFSNWVEKKTANIATISGGTSNMFYLWSNKELAEKKQFKLGWKGEVVDYTKAVAEFEKLKEVILKIIDYGSKDDFKRIDQLPLLKPIVKSKITFLYYPEKITSIMKPDDVSSVCMALDVPFDHDSPINSNHLLLNSVREVDSFKGWDSHKIGSFLYHNFVPAKKQKSPLGKTRSLCANISETLPTQ